MNVEIISVGTELLLGQIVNTNAQFLSKRLAALGYNCYYHTVVGDNDKRLFDAICTASQRADILLFTGGLGPTKDDLTKEVVCDVIQSKLVYDQASLDAIGKYFQAVGREITENNKKQALILEGSTVFFNHHGMAPGMATKVGNTHYILLPGPPKEMIPMFADVEAYLLQQLGKKAPIQSKVLRFFGIGEASLETKLIDLIEGQSNPTIAPLAADGEVTIRLSAKDVSEESADKLIKEMEEQIMGRVGEYLYGYDEETLLSKAISLIENNGYTISSAESLTGGLFGDQLTSSSGVSAVYKGGVICYQNEIKERILGIPLKVLHQNGSVSEECARHLADNVRALFCTDIGISFTGVAGPNSLEGHAPGTVYVGISIKGKDTLIIPLKLSGTRSQIKMASVKHGLYRLIKKLEE